MLSQEKLKLLQEEAHAENRVCTVRVFISSVDINHQKHFLLLRRSTKQTVRGQEEPPGGRVEALETLADAAVREVREETGIATPLDLHFLDFRDFTTAKGALVREFFFFATLDNTPPIVVSSEEHCSFRWARRDELATSEMHPLVRDLALTISAHA